MKKKPIKITFRKADKGPTKKSIKEFERVFQGKK